MTSQYAGEIINDSGGNNRNQSGLPCNFQQHHQGMMVREEMGQQRVNLSTGKRSFSDFSQQGQINFLPQQLQYQDYQQQQQRISYLQKVEQQQHLQNQYLIRSLSNNTNNNNNNDTNNFNNCSTGFVIPVQPKPDTYQRNNPTNNSNNNTNPIVNRVGKSNPGYVSVDPEDDEKLKELEKILFSDDDDAVAKEGVSDVTYSEWTVESFMNPSPNPSPSPVEPNVATPSITGSSCCSPAPITVLETVSVKQLVTETARAISEGEDDVAREYLSKLAEFGNLKGNSEERLVYYIGNALKSRAFPMEYPPPVNELYTADQISAMYSLFDISPCFKLGLMAANLVMLDAISTALKQGEKIIHLVDFDVSQAAQHVSLLRVLAQQKGISSLEIKVTIVKTELRNQNDVPDSVRDELVSLAERVGLNLKYSCVARAINELSRESIGCEENEVILVNFAFKLYRVPDESVTVDNLRDELLRRVKDFSPRAVTLIEQDLNGNTAPFMTRVAEAWGYYGALFDSLEVILGRDNLDRGRVEEAMGRKMGNLIACEGKDRVERAEVFGKWRARMGMAGFELKPINKKVVETMRAKLDLAKGGNPGFTVKEENGGVGFGWAGRGITIASAWR